MRLTAFTDYTLRVLMYLALNQDRTATVAEIADAYGISRLHLNKVVLELAQAGDIETTRGRNGGIRLAKRPDAINLADVVRRAEPDMQLAACFGSARACVLGRCCLLQGVLQRASHAFFTELARHTLADLVGTGGPTAMVFLNQQPPERPAPRRRLPPESSGRNRSASSR
ncbi:MAG TPA: Rrf2 family transcriptional regulator [Acetobacteraceae bacterium]|nr:Rrf2 family transcriptional regulator [Acetobacteraceae bacterium]